MQRRELTAIPVQLPITVSLSADTDVSGEAASTNAAVFDGDVPVAFEATLTNQGDEPLTFLKWLLPGGDLTAPVFSCTTGGNAVQFIGKLVKRPAPTSSDYLELKAGESFTTTIADFCSFYDCATTGEYICAYDVASMQLTSPSGTAFGTVTSDPIILTIHGRPNRRHLGLLPSATVYAGKATHHRHLKGAGGGNIRTGALAFRSCGRQQRQILRKNTARALEASQESLTYLSNLKGEGYPPDSPRFEEWFNDSANKAYVDAVRRDFTKIKQAFKFKDIAYDCSFTGCPPGAFAFVFRNEPYVIHLCESFWKAPISGTDTRKGTLIHEMVGS
jgi:peptidyl-Lys metalloendopeptidase